MGNSCGCDQILSGIVFATTAIFIMQIIIIVLAEDEINPDKIRSEVLSGQEIYEYLKNNSDKDKQCAIEFFKDIDYEKKYYDAAMISVRVLDSVSLLIIGGLCIYTLAMCCSEIKFNSLTFIVPIYEILSNIVAIAVINRDEIKCECEIKEFDEKINNLLSSQYIDNSVTLSVISGFAIVFDIFLLILLLCLKCRGEKKKPEEPSTVIIPISQLNIKTKKKNNDISQTPNSDGTH